MLNSYDLIGRLHTVENPSFVPRSAKALHIHLQLPLLFSPGRGFIPARPLWPSFVASAPKPRIAKKKRLPRFAGAVAKPFPNLGSSQRLATEYRLVSAHSHTISLWNVDQLLSIYCNGRIPNGCLEMSLQHHASDKGLAAAPPGRCFFNYGNR